MGVTAGALIYLRVTSMRNAVVSRFMRLKKPKYLLGAVIGLAYFYLVFGRRLRGDRPSAAALASAFPVEFMPMVITVAAVSVAIFIALLWLWPRERAALNFNETEIAFLFPAPIGRKTLIHFHLIGSQLKLLFTSLILALISSGWNFVLGNAWMRVVGWWLVFATVLLHLNGSAFTLTKWLDRGISQTARQLTVGALIVAIGAAAWLLTWSSWPPPESADLVDFKSTALYFTEMVNAGVVGYLLAPIKWIVGPLFAPSPATFLAALGPALAVYAAHYLWVLYSESSFEEASIARAKRRADKIAAMRSGNVRLGNAQAKPKRVRFDVGAVPRPEFAFLWKNLMAGADYLRLRTALLAAAAIVVGCFWIKNSDYFWLLLPIGLVALLLSGYVLVFGPMIARQDLRSDLLNIDMLKAYPLKGWQIVLGEMLAPTAIVTFLLWLGLLAAAMSFYPSGDWLTTEIRIFGGIGVALLVPFLVAIQVLVLNAGVLLFPAWNQASANKANAGIDVMGQRILFFAGLLLAMVVGMLPATIVAGAIYFITQFLLPIAIAAPLAVLGALCVLIAEISVGVMLLGTVFDKFDLSDELRP